MFKIFTKFFPKILKLFIFLAILSSGTFIAFTEIPKYYRRNQDNCSKIKQEIVKYDWDHDIAYAIMQAESKCDPEAKGDEKLIFKACTKDEEPSLDVDEPFKKYTEYPCNEKTARTFGYSVGAFQVRILPGRTKCDTFDIPTNVKCAYRVYQEKGNSFTPWSVFIDGKYKNFLKNK